MPKKNSRYRPKPREQGREYDPFDKRSPKELHHDLLKEMQTHFGRMTPAQKIRFLEKLAVFARLHTENLPKK